MIIVFNVLFLIFVITTLGQDSSSSSCHDVVIESEKQLAYNGWPFFVSCDIFANSEHFDLVNADFEADFQCVISNDDNVVVLNETRVLSNFLFTTSKNFGYLTSELNVNSSLNYTILVTDLSTRRCFRTSIHPNVSSIPNITCEDFLAENNLPLIPLPYDAQATARLDCDVKHDEYPKIDVVEGVTYQWLHNCNNVVAEQQRLLVTWRSIEQAGSYVCAANYNGRTRFLTARRYCLHKKLTIDTPPSLTCMSLKVLAKPGEEAQFICFSNFGEGKVDERSINIMWRKVGNGSTFQTCQLAESSNTRITQPCVYDNPHNQCYEHVPTEEEIKQNSVVTIFLTIRNVGKDDYGMYEMMVEKDNKRRINKTLTIAPNLTSALLSQAAIAGISIGAVFLFLIFILFMTYNSVYVRVYYKRYFGVQIIDDRVYGATFLYNYSHEHDRFSQDNVKSSVKFIRESLEQMGYKIHDEKRDGDYGLGFSSSNFLKCLEYSETIFNSVLKSHRLVIFLSLDFMKDDWSMLALQKGFDEMINSRSKLIFVLLPGMKEYLKQHSQDNVSCALIQRAIKLNYAVQWSSKNFKKKHFSFLLEDAMPKVTSQSRKYKSVFPTRGISSKHVTKSNCDSQKIDSSMV